MTAQSVATSGFAGIRPVAWILILAAIAAAGITAVGQGLLRSAFVIEPISVSNVIASASGFALAAAMLIGADRWPAGRSWLLGAAVALALAGMLDVIFQAWFISRQTEPRVLTDLESAGLFARAFVGMGSLALGTGLAAVGLWRGRPRTGSSRLSTSITAGIGVAAAVAVGGSVAVGVLESPVGPDPLLTVLQSVLLATVALTTAFLAFAASRHRPFGRHLPELTIGAGALFLLLLAAVRPWTLVLVPMEIDFETSKALFGVPLMFGAIGTILMVIGFASGRPGLGAGSADGPLSGRE